ncbi:MAG: ribose 5-phosphate isomerase B [bacterium]|nr:ribose 5-phosphate isomerase B [bacterium]
MRIAVGADHAGYRLKQRLVRVLEEEGHQIDDRGTFSEDSVDYPDFAAAVASEVASGDAELGLLVCGTGIGVGIAANKVDGIRAATCNDLFTARKSREHNDANILTVGSRVVGSGLAEDIVRTFFATDFEAGRHQRRVGKIHLLE